MDWPKNKEVEGYAAVMCSAGIDETETLKALQRMFVNTNPSSPGMLRLENGKVIDQNYELITLMYGKIVHRIYRNVKLRNKKEFNKLFKGYELYDGE